MKFAIYLLLVFLIIGIFKTHRSVSKSQSQEERFFAIRASVFTWLIGIGLLTAFLAMPMPQRVLFLLPASMAVMGLARFWRSGRTRLRREQQERVDLDRMKRVN